MSGSSSVAPRLLGGLVAALVTAAAISSSVSAQDTIPAGTPIAIRVAEEIDSRGADLQREYSAELAEPLVVDGATLAPKSSPAFLRVVQVQQAGAVSGRAALALRLEAIVANGQRIPIGTETVTTSSGSQGAKAAKGGILGGLAGAALGAAVGGGSGAVKGATIGASGGVGVAALSGQRVQVAKETRLTFTVAAARSVDTPSVGAAAQDTVAAAPVASQNAGRASLTATARSIRFEVSSVVADGSTLTVSMFAINQGVDRTLAVYTCAGCQNWGVKLIDDAGGTFYPAEYTVGNQRNVSDIVNGVRTPITLTFTKMPTVGGKLQATQVRRITCVFGIRQGNAAAWQETTVMFEFIPIQKN